MHSVCLIHSFWFRSLFFSKIRMKSWIIISIKFPFPFIKRWLFPQKDSNWWCPRIQWLLIRRSFTLDREMSLDKKDLHGESKVCHNNHIGCAEECGRQGKIRMTSNKCSCFDFIFCAILFIFYFDYTGSADTGALTRSPLWSIVFILTMTTCTLRQLHLCFSNGGMWDPTDLVLKKKQKKKLQT